MEGVVRALSSENEVVFYQVFLVENELRQLFLQFQGLLLYV